MARLHRQQPDRRLTAAATSPRAERHEKRLPTLPGHVKYPSRVSQAGRRVVRGWWAWELIAATVTLVATAVLLGVFAQADQRPPQSWTVGGTALTLNALVVVISTVMCSALMLVVAGALNQGAWNWFASKHANGRDGASRAAPGRPLKDLEIFGEAAAHSWNSLKLIYHTKGRCLASLGALLIVLSIAFEAFVQQVLGIGSIPQHAILSGSALGAENMLPRMQVFDGDTSLEFPDPRVDIGPVAVRGMVTTNSTLPGAICSQESCSWPVTTTLGVCSMCSDVTSKIVASDQSQSDDGYHTEIAKYSLPVPLPDGGGWESRANEEMSFWYNSTFFTDQGAASSEIWTVKTLAFRGEPGQTRGPAIFATTYAFGISAATNVTGFQIGSPLEKELVAYNCSFYFCVQGFKAELARGSMTQERILATSDQVKPLVNDRWWEFDAIPAPLNAVEQSVYRVNGNATYGLGIQFANLLDGSATLLDRIDIDGQGHTSMNTSGLVANSFWAASGSLANTSALAESIAASMTSHFRTLYAAPPDERYAPAVTSPLIVVTVTWAWLAYPLALVVAGLSFLALTMAATKRRRVRPWKGHKIPLVLAEMDESVRIAALGGLMTRTGLEDRVGRMKVRLDFDGLDAIVFRRVENGLAARNAGSSPIAIREERSPYGTQTGPGP